MTDLSTMGLAVGLLLVLLGIKDTVRIRAKQIVIEMSLGGFLIAASLGFIVI